MNSLTHKPLLSIVIPFYNESTNLERIFNELHTMWQGHKEQFDLEIIFMDNHSNDRSFEIASRLLKENPSIKGKIIRLSRNFGYQINILNGFLNAKGDAAVQLDADGEDDPALIPAFFQKWKEGYQVVYGVRKKRKESFLLTWQRKLFYRILKSLSAIPIPVDAGDFRLIDRKVIESLKHFKEANPYLRGLIAYSGFSQIGIDYERRPRYSNISKFNWWGYLQLAVDGITSFSRKPLAFSTWIGFLLAICSFLGTFFYLVLFLAGKVNQPGFTTLVLLLLFLSGTQLVCLGIMGAYVGRIFDEVKSRPRGIIEQEITFE